MTQAQVYIECVCVCVREGLKNLFCFPFHEKLWAVKGLKAAATQGRQDL